MNFAHFRTRGLRRSAQKHKTEKLPLNAFICYSPGFGSVFSRNRIQPLNPVRVARGDGEAIMSNLYRENGEHAVELEIVVDYRLPKRRLPLAPGLVDKSRKRTTKNEHRRRFELGLPTAELRIDKDSGPWPNAPARYLMRLIPIKPPTKATRCTLLLSRSLRRFALKELRSSRLTMRAK